MSNERSLNGAAHHRVTEDILVLTAGIGTGAGLMYLCDPARGRARREHLIAGVSHLVRADEVRMAKRAKDLIHRAQGLAAEAVSVFAKHEPVPDEVLVERVRSRMGHLVSHPLAVDVHAKNGVVTLEGSVTRAEKRRFREEVARVPGVRRVDDQLRSGSLLAPGIMMGLAAGLALLRRTAISRAHEAAGRAH